MCGGTSTIPVTAVIIPTIQGRAEHLERCLTAYAATSPQVLPYVETDHPSCGAAWLAGAGQAQRTGFDYLHFSADDLEPHDGWLEPAIQAVDNEMIPAPLVFNANGDLDSAGLEGFGQYRGPYMDWQLSDGTTVPFVSREMWEKIAPEVEDIMGRTHYCTDLLVSAAGRRHGWETAIRTGMRFTHHVAQPGRNYGRVQADTEEYVAWLNAS